MLHRANSPSRRKGVCSRWLVSAKRSWIYTIRMSLSIWQTLCAYSMRSDTMILEYRYRTTSMSEQCFHCTRLQLTNLPCHRYTSQSPSALISRLTLRNHHLLALRICSFLKISGAPVLRHWAQLKVLTSKNDATDSQKTCNIIVNRLKENYEGAQSLDGSQVSCADVAKTAWDQGKTALAAKVSPTCHVQAKKADRLFRCAI
jgi:hypothetical protein